MQFGIAERWCYLVKLENASPGAPIAQLAHRVHPMGPLLQGGPHGRGGPAGAVDRTYVSPRPQQTNLAYHLGIIIIICISHVFLCFPMFFVYV